MCDRADIPADIQADIRMDHRRLVASLGATERRRLTAKTDGPGLRRLALQGGLILLLGALIAARVPGWPLLTLPQGLLIVFLFSLEHEAIHRTAFRTHWLNEAAAWAAGLAIALPPSWFRYFHFAHHRFTQDPAKDPELTFPKPGTLRQYIIHASGIPLWRGQLKRLAINAAGGCRDGFVPPHGGATVRREARAMAALYAALAAVSIWAGSAVLIYAWIIPILLGQPFLRLFLLAEHGHCPLVANMLENTRTTFTNRLVRLVAWNMSFHAEHHAWPAVPFHRLPEFHTVAAAHLGETEAGYVRFNLGYARALG